MNSLLIMLAVVVGLLILAALFHATINIANSLTVAGIKPESLNPILPGGFVVAAIVVVTLAGTHLTQNASPQTKVQAVE